MNDWNLTLNMRYRIYTPEMNFQGRFMEEVNGYLVFDCDNFRLSIKRANCRQLDLIERRIWVVSD